MADTTDSVLNDVTGIYLPETNNIFDVFINNDNESVLNSSTSNATGPSAYEIFSEYTLREVTVFLSTYYLWVILAVGVPGNLASIFTILSMPTVTSSKAHVAILAAADTCAIVLKLTYSEVSKDGLKLTTPGCAIIMFLQQFFHTYVNWIVVAMTAERFVAVWFPLRVGRIYTRKKAWLILAIFAYLTAFLYACFFWIFKEEYDPYYGYHCQPREKFIDFLNSNFWYWFEGSFYSVIPCTLVLMGNILIITNIRKAKRAHRHLTNSYEQGGDRKARDQRQITIMLIVVSVVFLVLNLPNAAMYVAKPHWNPVVFSYEYAQKDFMFRFVHILSDTNHAVNFFLYFLSMSTFRRRFMDAIRCRSAKRRPAGSMYRTSQTYMASSQHEISRSGDVHGPRSINNVHPLRTSSCVMASDSRHSLKSCHSSHGGGRMYNNHTTTNTTASSTTPSDSAV